MLAVGYTATADYSYAYNIIHFPELPFIFGRVFFDRCKAAGTKRRTFLSACIYNTA